MANSFYEIRRVRGNGSADDYWQLWRYNRVSFLQWFRGARTGWEFITNAKTEHEIRKEMARLVGVYLRAPGREHVVATDRYMLDGSEFKGGGWA